MKVLAVFAAVLAVSSAQIIYSNDFGINTHLGLTHGIAHAHAPLLRTAAVAAPAVVAAAPAVIAAPVATKTQYHAQDELGQASFGHSEPGQAHAAVRDAAGGVSGTFSYISPEGIPFTTHYRADHNGYRVASNALPVAPSVAIAGPIDTPEVQAAKAQHAAAHADALIRSGRRKRGLVYSSAVAAPAWNYAYSAPVYSHAVAAPAVVAAAPVVRTAVAAPAATVLAAPVAHHTVAVAPAVRAATLTKVVNTPGHAVSYRVD
jgi:hypothetical protein